MSAITETSTPSAGRYTGLQRAIHWITAALIFGLVPVGIIMSNRGAAGIWDGLTNTMYQWHKLFGFIVLCLVVVRILVKARSGTPPYPANMAAWQKKAAHALHGLVYVLLLAVPLTGWAGVTAFPALITVGGYNLPPMPFVPQSEDLAKVFFRMHMFAAISLVLLVLGHIGAALMHLVVFRDGVFQRMTGK